MLDPTIEGQSVLSETAHSTNGQSFHGTIANLSGSGLVDASLSYTNYLNTLEDSNLIPTELSFSIASIFSQAGFQYLIDDSLSARSSDLISIHENLSQAFSVVRDQLTGMIESNRSNQIFALSFGDAYDPYAANLIQQNFSSGIFSDLPLIRIVSSDILGYADGAYAIQTNNILLSEQLVARGNFQDISAVILEEIGHSIDSVINTTDTPGDEGYIFASLVQGRSITSNEFSWLKQQDDHATIEYGNQMMVVEQSLPTVGLSVLDPNAAEVNPGQAPNPGSFRVSRTGSTATALTVNYTIGGNATNGADYSRLTGSIVIPVGASSVILPINTVNDNLYEGPETVVIALQGSSAYTLAASSSGTVAIADNDPFPSITDRDGNDNLSTASFIGAWQRNISGISGQGFVGSTDSQDFYRFGLAQISNVNITLGGISQNSARLELIRDLNGNGFYDSNERLYSDTAYTYNNGVINTALGAGVYFVRVATSSSSVNTNYVLSLSSTIAPPNTPSDPGDTLGATALNIGQLTTNRSFREFVGSVDPIDTYRFTLANTSNVNLTLSGVGQNLARLELVRDINGNGFYDSNERLYSNTAYTYDNGVINTALGAGAYFVRVISPNNTVNTNYVLSLGATATPPTTPRDPGDTLGTALNVGLLTTNRAFREFVGSVDPVDTYRFALTNTSNVNLTLSGVGQNLARLELVRDINGNGFYDSNERLYSNTAYTYDNGVINTALGAGAYFVRVVSPNNTVNTNYVLSLGATATPPSTPRDPGDTLGTALNVGLLTANRAFREFVGSVDPIDTYRFALTSTRNINLTLSGVSQSLVRLELVRDINGNGFYDSNERLYSDTAYTYSNGLINATLGAGAYFVRVVSNSNSVNANYLLTLGPVA